MTKFEKIDLFLQQEISKRPKHSLLKELYEHKNFSNEELLYLFPNNKLKRFGLPMKRGGSKKKKKMRQKLFDQRLFNIIEDMIDDILTKQLTTNSFFQEFVEVKNVSLGDPNEFHIDTNYMNTNIKRITKYV